VQRENFDAKHQIGQRCNTSHACKHTYRQVTPCLHINYQTQISLIPTLLRDKSSRQIFEECAMCIHKLLASQWQCAEIPVLAQMNISGHRHS